MLLRFFAQRMESLAPPMPRDQSAIEEDELATLKLLAQAEKDKRVTYSSK